VKTAIARRLRFLADRIDHAGAPKRVERLRAERAAEPAWLGLRPADRQS
jgi:hypothetical protein